MKPICLALCLFALPSSLSAAPQAVLEPQRLVVTAADYRVAFQRYRCEFQLELRDAHGDWRAVVKKGTQPEFALVDPSGVHGSQGPAKLRHAVIGDAVAVGLTTLLPGSPPTHVRVHALCTDGGLLIGFAPEDTACEGTGTYWALPRLTLDETLFDSYAYWRTPDEYRAGTLLDLGQPQVYVGSSPWGREGDTASQLSDRHPAIVAQSPASGLALGVVLLNTPGSSTPPHSFLQRYDGSHVYFYPGMIERAAAAKGVWAWLAPLPLAPPAAAAKVERLLPAGQALLAGFQSLAPEPEEDWTKPVPDFPAALRRSQPVDDIGQAVVYTINETILAPEGIELARKTGSDVLIRGWFKWGTAADFSKLAPLVSQAHALGALFGGGITCSALYHGENGLDETLVLDMATRGPEGQLVDAWGESNCRHGTLSNPAYLEYLLDWCQRQIDHGVDYLFMDEINAALQADEGFDDYALADFRQYLLDRHGQQGWTPTDARWREVYQIDLTDPAIAADGTLGTFHYRAYLKARNLAANPHAITNPLADQWHAFREARDDRAWKWLTDAIREYAAARGRRVLISGNGLARYVDLQVLGVWGNWKTAQGRIDLSESQLPEWGSIVAAGWGLAGRRIPVVLFHDWGFGGFPWLEISPEDRRLWMRIRGAEIYAAGGFFAFPVHGPFGNDSRVDGTLAEIARQSRFYHEHADLYLAAEPLGFEPLEASEPGFSLALWRRPSPPSLILHVINRQIEQDQPTRRTSIEVQLPTSQLPRRVRWISPDWPGDQLGTARVANGRLTLTAPVVEAYSVAVLEYEELPDVKLVGRRIVPTWQWARPARNEFVVQQGGLVRDQWALPGMLQGRLHQQLRNPPTFVVNMPQGGTLQVHVRGVATLGAQLQWQVDGRLAKTVELPDRDGKNESHAGEYDQTYEFPIPPGRHRLGLDNGGGDWACIAWYALSGETLDP